MVNTSKRFDAMLELALLDCCDADYEMFMNLDDSNVELSDHLWKRIEKQMKREKKKKPASKAKTRTFKILFAATLTLSLIFLTLLSISATRNALWEVFTEWFDDYISIRFEPSTYSLPADTSTSAESAITTDDPSVTTQPVEDPPAENPPAPPTTIETVRKPTALPEGVEEEMVMNLPSVKYYEFYIGDDWYCSYQQKILADEFNVDNQYSEATRIEFDSCYGFFIHSEDGTDSLTWTDGEYLYIIESLLSKQNIIDLAKSVE